MNALPDLGWYYYSTLKAKPETSFQFLVCNAVTILAVGPGQSKIIFQISMGRTFFGQIILEAEPVELFARLKSWGSIFSASASICPELSITTSDGSQIIPFCGKIFQSMEDAF